MIEELLDWELSHRNLKKLARDVEEVNKDFWTWSCTLVTELPNRGDAHSLNQRLPQLRERLARLNPKTKFDKLVAKEFDRSLFEQIEYVKFFSFDNYNRETGVRDFMDWICLPMDEAGERKGQIFDRICHRASQIRYPLLSKRESLMQSMTDYQIDYDFDDVTSVINRHHGNMRRLISHFSLTNGFITSDQAGRIERYAMLEALKSRVVAVTQLFGKPYPFLRKADPFMDAKIFGSERAFKKLLSEEDMVIKNWNVSIRPPEEDIKDLVYSLHSTLEDYSSFDGPTKRMTLNSPRFVFYLDPKTRSVRAYLGDINLTLVHENFHRFQTYFSNGMPPSLREAPGGATIGGQMIMEGVATMLEESFIEYAEENQDRVGMTKQDIKIAKLYKALYLGRMTVKFLHTMLHRQYNVEGKTDKDVHIELSRITGNYPYKDDHHLDEMSFAEASYYMNYIIGLDYAQQMKQNLKAWVKNKLGTRRNKTVDRFMKNNEGIIMQGMLTGYFGFTTKEKWLLCHYMPRAWKYCEK